MLDVVLSNRFKKDLKLAARRGMNLAELDAIVEQLAAQPGFQKAESVKNQNIFERMKSFFR